jgi:lysophospholipase L1-like esterase
MYLLLVNFPSMVEFQGITPPHPRPNWLDLDTCAVRWHHMSSGTVHRLQASKAIWQALQVFQPHLLFLQIGSNDLDGLGQESEPFQVAYAISKLVDEYIQAIPSVRNVFVGQLVKRRTTRTVGLSVNYYNDKIYKTNGYVQDFCDSLGRVPVCLWHHKGISNSKKNIYTHDKVHMNRLGNLKLYRSVRAAVKSAM